MTSMTFPVFSEKCLLSLAWLLLTYFLSLTSEVLQTRYFFTSNMAFFMLLLLIFTVSSVKVFVCLLQTILEISWVIFGTLVSFLAVLCPWPINDTPKQIKNWSKKIDHFCHVDQAVYLGLQIFLILINYF